MNIALLTCEKEFNKNEDDLLIIDTVSKNNPGLIKHCAWNDPSVPWHEFDKIVIRTPWDYSQNITEFFNFISNPLVKSKLINSFEVINWNINKTYLKELVGKKIPVIETEFISDWNIQTIMKAINSFESKTIILKPSVSAGGRGVYLLKEKDEAHILQVLNEIPKTGELMIQPFKSEISDGEFSAVIINNTLYHTVIKKPSGNGFKVQSRFGGTTGLYSTKPVNQEFCMSVLNAVANDIRYGRIDYIIENGSPWLMELELFEPDLFLRENPEALHDYCAMVL